MYFRNTAQGYWVMGKPLGRRHNRHIDLLIAELPPGVHRDRFEEELLERKSPRQIAKLCKRQKKKAQATEARAQ